MNTFVIAMMGAAIIALVLMCGFMYHVICLAQKNMAEYRDLLQYIVRRHQYMPRALLRKVREL